MRVSVWDSKEVQAAILALNYVGKELRRDILKRTRAAILPEWQQAIGEEISNAGGDIYATKLIMRNTRIRVGTQGFSLQAATLNKPTTSGGLIPSQDWHLAELGGIRKTVPVQGRRGTTTYQYKREVNTGFRKRYREGRYAYKAANKMIYRAMALFTQTAIKSVYEAFERK